MDYSPITFKDIYSPNNDNEIVYDESGHDTHYQNNGSRFGQTPENLIPSYTGCINTQNIEKFSDNGEYYGSPNANVPRFHKGEYYNQQKENFDVNSHGDGSYWNGTLVKNNISTNVNERFTSNSDDCCVNCKRNTFLLYLIIALLVILYFKK
jgi:hypothetical protein